MQAIENSSWMTTYWPAAQDTLVTTMPLLLLFAKQVALPEQVVPTLAVTALELASTVTQTLFVATLPILYVFWYTRL